MLGQREEFGLEKHNQDVFPSAEMVALYAGCRPVVVNPIIDDAFLEYERKAVVAKRTYHRRGRLGTMLVLISVTFTVAGALVVPAHLPAVRELSIVAVSLGALGLAIQLNLLITGKKKSWLVNRFATERLRSIKFQAYQFAFTAASAEDLQIRVDEFYASELARLRAELNAGEAALGMFSPIQATMQPRVKIKHALAPGLADIMQKAYRELRIEYQQRFASAEIRSLMDLQRVGYATADILYVVGAFLTLAALFGKLVFPNNEDLARWIDFLAIISFTTGLSRTILENASLSETSRGRYEEYLRALAERDRELRDDDISFPEIVRQMERIILGELSQFCSAASQISYRL